MTAGVVCIDVGSTFTKAALVSLPDGALLATSSVPTTLITDVMAGIDACLTHLGAAAETPVLACSSAGGGLRIAVVGYEQAVTAEAGQRVALSAGGRVVHVSAGSLNDAALALVVAARPDVVLLVGGTDGGNADVLIHNAALLARTSVLPVPVVVAGNSDARDQVVDLFHRVRRQVIGTANVLPAIGVLDAQPAREAIRDVFVRHVIGGKGLSEGPRFAQLVRGATPDIVLRGVELLGDLVGDVLVVDIGGATTDVYSVVTPEGEDAVLRREVVGPLWHSRTVEGDLGMRWNAPGVVAAAREERLLDPAEDEALTAAAGRRAADPAYVAPDGLEQDVDARLAELAVTVALRRHGRPSTRGGSAGAGAAKDLRRVRLVVGSGGVLRHGDLTLRERVLRPSTTDHGGGWRVPDHARTTVDGSYVLAAAGLLADEHPVAAAGLLRLQLAGSPT